MLTMLPRSGWRGLVWFGAEEAGVPLMVAAVVGSVDGGVVVVVEEEGEGGGCRSIWARACLQPW